MSLAPEQEARRLIDAAMHQAGWVVQDRAEMNLAAGRGVAVREFKMTSDHGFADYLLFVDGKAVGALEAKPVGYRLINVELQVGKCTRSSVATVSSSRVKYDLHVRSRSQRSCKSSHASPTILSRERARSSSQRR